MSLTQVGTHALLTGDTDATIPPRSSGDCCQRPMAASHKARLTPCCPAAGSSPSIATTSETSSESGVSITCSLARFVRRRCRRNRAPAEKAAGWSAEAVYNTSFVVFSSSPSSDSLLRLVSSLLRLLMPTHDASHSQHQKKDEVHRCLRQNVAASLVSHHA